MKKVMMLVAIAAALVSCQSKGTQNNNATAASEEAVATVADEPIVVAMYEGVLPAADGPGIRYVLSVGDVTDEKEGDYALLMTYLDAEGPGKDKSFTSQGKKQFIKKSVDGKEKTALKLTPDNGDAPIYFMVMDRKTLRLVNDSLEEAASGLNYDIHLR